MAIWKQILVSLVVLAAIAVLWYFYFPGAQDVATRLGVPALAAKQDAGGAGPGGGAGRPGGFPGGFGGGRETSVIAEPATLEVINNRLSALGDGTALHSVTVVPSASGTLVDVLVDSGARVSKGDVIARLDSDEEQIAADKARLALADAEATLDRYSQLRDANLTAVQMQSARLAVDNARLALQSAELTLSNRQIVAPIDGRIGIVQVDAGNTVTTQTEIATIEDRSDILISFWVPERLTGAVTVGEPVKAVPVARPGQEVAGKIVAVDNKIDPASGTFEVQARVPNDKDDLRAGMSFTVSMDFTGDSFVAVNPLAIQWGSDGAYVWRMVDAKAKRTNIRIVQRNSETVLVAGDIAAGDMVITEGLTGLREGAAVKLAGATNAEDTAPRGAAGGGAAKAGEKPNGGKPPNGQPAKASDPATSN